MTETPKQKETVLQGGIWTMLSKIFTQLTQFAIFMVAVRLMTPAEFGVFALAAAVIVILTQVSTAGWPEYIMQWHGDRARIRETLCVAMICGFVIAVIGVFGGGFAATLFSDPAVGPLVQILSISVFFTSVGAAYNGVMVWQNRLSGAALVTLLADLANLIVAIWALLQGYGVLALAWGRLVSAVIWSASGAVVSRTKPVMVHPDTLADSAAFSWKIILTRVVVNIRIYAATLIIGGFLGATSVGYFRAAQRIVAAFEEIVSEPTRILSWNLFRRSRDAQGGSVGFGAVALRFFPVLYYGAVPLFVGVILMADTLTAGILGPGWEPATPVLRILAVAALIRCSGHASLAILTLAGQVWLLPWVTALYSGIAIAAVLAAASFGIAAIAMAEVVAATIAFVINAVIMKRYAGIAWQIILLKTWAVLPAVALACIPVILADMFSLLSGVNDLIRFIVLGLCMMVVFVPAILVLDKSLRAMLRNRRGPGAPSAKTT
ncbi:oligosaccharide flippase family protein [Ruegeria sp. R14_0]|uniref:oligosaccharide flippase family protein n=1 Tax=Ruegeria sp. R14_0 TaxID=2821100 RepID=UPI001ADB20D4|nr:oligosaccharide flippase family protein [Ruegeria sp. R14_0]MBO9446715.1 oligosaccharide flippase family protein [Ruegeria sp. R14_0]